MRPLDYGRSFLISTWPDNQVRFQVESRTRISNQNGQTEDYIQCASCKSEDTFAEHDLFYEDNYDFLPIFGPDYGLIFRRKAWLNSDYKRCQKTKDMWDGPSFHLVECESLEELTTPSQILQATQAGHPLIAQTEIENDETGLHAVIEYPVKTMNTKSDGNIYQV